MSAHAVKFRFGQSLMDRTFVRTRTKSTFQQVVDSVLFTFLLNYIVKNVKKINLNRIKFFAWYILLYTTLFLNIPEDNETVKCSIELLSDIRIIFIRAFLQLIKIVLINTTNDINV